ncbi:ribosome biogenesis protein Nop16 [Podospora australis]|uniref:Nucleolar protein 16 n=1 Tax=Podospora australis TaxID=1536484 RepID=A0AAN6WRX1_9PEZI|nr:ribosome biogenesis protein Nop16 [Podospora australis]
MGRELQKRKARSSRSKVKIVNRRKKALNPLGNSIIAQNWNKKETLSQNYTRFGIVAKLGKTTGGTAPTDKSKIRPEAADSLAVKSADQGLLSVREVKVERDADGKIVRILRDTNPLNDPLNDLESDSEAEEKEYEEWGGFKDGRVDTTKSEVLKALEEEASRPEVKQVRHSSEREVEWLQRLVDKYGDNVGAMARDRRLNPMQQTPADITRRLKKAGMWKA